MESSSLYDGINWKQCYARRQDLKVVYQVKCAYLLSLSTKSGISEKGEVEHELRISESDSCRTVDAKYSRCLVLLVIKKKKYKCLN